jgi:hypothetical protein
MGTVIEHILAAWEHAAPAEHKERLRKEIVRRRAKGMILPHLQRYAVGRLDDGLSYGNWDSE